MIKFYMIKYLISLKNDNLIIIKIFNHVWLLRKCYKKIKLILVAIWYLQLYRFIITIYVSSLKLIR